MKRQADYDATRAELIEMARIDQEMRNESTETGEWDASVDEHNTARLKQIIDEIGWPRISQVGFEAAQDAWLLAQHADADVAFQESCLIAIRQLSADEYQSSNLAYLEDRVRVNTGRPQLYGTQFMGSGSDFDPRPIEDEAHVDERRAVVGLGPLDEYRAQMEQFRQRPPERAEPEA